MFYVMLNREQQLGSGSKNYSVLFQLSFKIIGIVKNLIVFHVAVLTIPPIRDLKQAKCIKRTL